MKFYLASAFKYTDAVKQLAERLEARGHTITCRWWMKDFKVALNIEDNDEWYSQPIIRTIYQRSFKAIQDADILILVAPKKTKFNGANVEVGIAQGLHKPIICYGKLDRSAMYEPLIRCPNWSGLDEILIEFEEH